MKRLFFLLFLSFLLRPALHAAPAELIIGIDADMSGGAAQAGIAIYRGASLAVSEINGKGGVLGRPLKLKVLDHRGNPARGLANMENFSETPGLLAVMGGLHTPVALEELAIVHERHMPFLIPWAAGTAIVENGYTPNYVFRVSVRDADAGIFLIQKILEAGYRSPGLLLEQTGWGRSNEKAMVHALAIQGLQPVGVQWFHWGTTELHGQIRHLRDADADIVILVANPSEGLAAVRALTALPPQKRLPLVSHWGITGGDFARQAGKTLGEIPLYFLQTFSFLAPPRPEKAAFLHRRYADAFPSAQNPGDIPAPPAVAHAYDLVHILARAVEKAGCAERPSVRQALENLDFHDGVMKPYSPPFTPSRHDALSMEDFRIACFDEESRIIPCTIAPKKNMSVPLPE